MQGRSQQLPGKPANPQLVKMREALAEMAAAQRAVKAADGRDPGGAGHAAESLALAALRAEATGRFGGGGR